jgi:DNA-binding IscR family transcriptional regulator
VRGPRGGYLLAKERRRTTVGEIVRVVHAMETTDDPLIHSFGSPLAQMVVRPLWLELQEGVMVKLESVTIEDLCSRAGLAGIASEVRQSLDFSI